MDNKQREFLNKIRKGMIIFSFIYSFIAIWGILNIGQELWVENFMWDNTNCSVFINFLVIVFCGVIFGYVYIIPIVILWLIYFILWLVFKYKK